MSNSTKIPVNSSAQEEQKFARILAAQERQANIDAANATATLRRLQIKATEERIKRARARDAEREQDRKERKEKEKQREEERKAKTQEKAEKEADKNSLLSSKGELSSISTVSPVLAGMAFGPLGVLLAQSKIGQKTTGKIKGWAGDKIKKLGKGLGNGIKKWWSGGLDSNKSADADSAITQDAKEEAAAPIKNLEKTVKTGFDNVLNAMGAGPIKKDKEGDEKKSLFGKLGDWLLDALGLSTLLGGLKKGIKNVGKKALGWMLKALAFGLSPLKWLGSKIFKMIGLGALWDKMAQAVGRGWSKVMRSLGFDGGIIFDKKTGRWRDTKTGKFTKSPKGSVAKTAGAKAAGKTAAKMGGKTLAKTIGKGVLGGVAGLGLGIAGDLVHDYGAQALQSAGMGEKAATNTANYGGSALKGAALGATIGSIIPGVGTLIGGAIGGVAGLIAQAGKDIHDNVKENRAQTTGEYKTPSNEFTTIAVKNMEDINGNLKAIISALNKMNANLDPDVQHSLDKQYLQEMLNLVPAPEIPLNQSPMGITRETFGGSPLTLSKRNN